MCVLTMWGHADGCRQQGGAPLPRFASLCSSCIMAHLGCPFQELEHFQLRTDLEVADGDVP